MHAHIQIRQRQIKLRAVLINHMADE